MREDKRGMIVAHMFDYIFIIFIALFGFIFIYLNFVGNVNQRDKGSLTAITNTNNVQQYIAEHRVKFENGKDVNITNLLQNKRYLQKYRQLPSEEILPPESLQERWGKQ